jgi:maltooligosyltrehalose trehalohydrolase
MNLQRRYPIGAELQPNGSTHFRVWAPRPKKVEVLLEAGPGAPATVQLKQQEDGYFAGLVPQAADGTRYRFRLDDAGCFPDPVSRYQPDGPHGASQVVDPSDFGWNDSGWQGVGLEGQIIYEMHIGTFTREGTWQAAQRELAELAGRLCIFYLLPVCSLHGFNFYITLFPIYRSLSLQTDLQQRGSQKFSLHALWLLCPFFPAKLHQS